MKKYFSFKSVSIQLLALLSACFLLIPVDSFCQIELPPLPSIDELRAPTSPAFTLLDVSPSSVERPNTPRALALSILSSTERSNGDFPQDLAIEFAPYWFTSHPKLTFEKYYNPNLAQGILQSLSFSIATTEIPNEANNGQEDGTRSGFGLRFLLLPGDEAPDLKQRVKELKDKQLTLLDLIPDDPSTPVDTESPEFKKREAEVKKAGEAVRKLDKQRVGWVVEFAAAVSVDFPENDTSEADVTREGFWLTPSYRTPTKESLLHNFIFVGVGRYIWDDSMDDSDNLFDIGGRIIWKSTHIPLYISVEYVRRFIDGDSDTDKIAGVLEYRLLDFLSLIASYGKDFDDDFSGKDDLIAVAGIKFGFGKGPIVQ